MNGLATRLAAAPKGAAQTLRGGAEAPAEAVAQNKLRHGQRRPRRPPADRVPITARLPSAALALGAPARPWRDSCGAAGVVPAWAALPPAVLAERRRLLAVLARADASDLSTSAVEGDAATVTEETAQTRWTRIGESLQKMVQRGKVERLPSLAGWLAGARAAAAAPQKPPPAVQSLLEEASAAYLVHVAQTRPDELCIALRHVAQTLGTDSATTSVSVSDACAMSRALAAAFDKLQRSVPATALALVETAAAERQFLGPDEGQQLFERTLANAPANPHILLQLLLDHVEQFDLAYNSLVVPRRKALGRVVETLETGLPFAVAKARLAMLRPLLAHVQTVAELEQLWAEVTRTLAAPMAADLVDETLSRVLCVVNVRGGDPVPLLHWVARLRLALGESAELSEASLGAVSSALLESKSPDFAVPWLLRARAVYGRSPPNVDSTALQRALFSLCDRRKSSSLVSSVYSQSDMQWVLWVTLQDSLGSSDFDDDGLFS